MGSLKQERIDLSLKHIYQVARASVSYITFKNQELTAWPLFFSEESQYQRNYIDTAATSFGILIILNYHRGNFDNGTKQLLVRSINTLLTLRNDDGSWPSEISIVTEKSPNAEGIIYNTVFALNALLEAGFLDLEPRVNLENTNQHFITFSFDERADFILESVNWLISNRAWAGWDYTGISKFENQGQAQPAVLPTSNVIILLKKIIDKLETVKPEKIDPIMDEVLQESLNWLHSLQDENGGFGKKRGAAPTVPHTCMAVHAMLSSPDLEYGSSAYKSLKWILNNKKAYNPDLIDIEDLFDKYDQYVIGDNNKIFRADINHENFYEPMVLSTVSKFIDSANGSLSKGNLHISLRYKIKIKNLVTALTSSLFRKQVQSGHLHGAIKSKRGILSQLYPIYGAYHSLEALNSIKKNLHYFKRIPYIKTLIIQRFLVTAVLLAIVSSLLVFQGTNYMNASITIITTLLIDFVFSFMSLNSEKKH